MQQMTLTSTLTTRGQSNNETDTTLEKEDGIGLFSQTAVFKVADIHTSLPVAY